MPPEDEVPPHPVTPPPGPAGQPVINPDTGLTPEEEQRLREEGTRGAPYPEDIVVAQIPPGDPQVNFPPSPDSRIYVPGTEPPMSERFPVPYEPPVVTNPGPWAYGIGGIGAILTGVIGAMWEGWPNELGGDEWLGRIPRQGEQGPPPETQVPQPEEGALGPVPESIYGPPGVGDPSQIYNPVFPEPYPETLPPPAGDIEYGPTPDVGPPQGARQPTPTPTPTPTLPPWVWPLIGGLGAIQLGRSGRRSSMTLPEIALSPPGLTVINEPLISSAQLAQPWPLTATASSFGYEAPDDGCKCSKKRSGKKRKCLARAQLTWRSGPKKGRAAGSRCYRFAD